MKSLRFIRKTFVYRDIPSSGVMCLLSIIRYHKGAVDSAVYCQPASQQTEELFYPIWRTWRKRWDYVRKPERLPCRT